MATKNAPKKPAAKSTRTKEAVRRDVLKIVSNVRSGLAGGSDAGDV